MARGRPGRAPRPRGEINEVIAQLEKLSALDGRRPDVVRSKRDTLQKLIRYMTAGIDMSAAFIPATKCVALSKHDLPLKKSLYLYLRTAARQNAAVALLVVQTLLTDAKDPDPTIRGLAVRSIASLRVPDLMDNVFAAIDSGLKDAHPYVREVAVIGILKCHQQDPAGTRARGLLDAVKTALATDGDPQVVANCLYVLQQLNALNSDVITRQLVVSLLNHITAFSDWAQCLVLDVLLAYYRPASESERFDVLEVLDFGLNHTNTAVVMATAKLFLHYTAAYPDQHAAVMASIKGPMQTALLGREPEVVYAALSNLIALAQRHPDAFADLAPDLFCRPEDPSYLKLAKLEALVAVSGPGNAFEAAEEAAQYARDGEGDVARAAVRAVARIAARAAGVDGIVDRLLLFLNAGRPEVAEEAVAAMADVLRRFPAAADACVPSLAEVDPETLHRPAARAAFAWTLGEFGGAVQDAPYTLESLVGGFSEEQQETKLALLVAVMKLFFKRAPECRAALGAVLAAGAADTDASVRDRALFYHRLLSEAGPEAARAVVAAPRPAGGFDNALPAEVQDRIFDEWNTLSTVYRAPAATFIDPGELGAGERHETDSVGGGDVGEDHALEGGVGDAAADGGTALLLDLGDTASEGGVSGGGPASDFGGGSVTPRSATPPATAGGSASDLLEGLAGLGAPPPASPTRPPPSPPLAAASGFDMLGDLLGGGSSNGAAVTAAAATAVAPVDDLDAFFGGLGGAAPAPAPAAVATAAAATEQVDLLPSPSIAAAEFQAGWAQWGAGVSATQDLGGAATLAAISARGFREFSEHVGQAHIATLATPREGAPPPLRFLLHAQRRGGSGARVLAQVTVTAGGATAEINVKSQDNAAAQHVLELLQNLLLTI